MKVKDLLKSIRLNEESGKVFDKYIRIYIEGYGSIRDCDIPSFTRKNKEKTLKAIGFERLDSTIDYVNIGDKVIYIKLEEK